MVDFTGNSLPNSPRFKISFTGEQTFPLGRYGAHTLRYDGVWTDVTYYDATEGSGFSIPGVGFSVIVGLAAGW